MSGASPHQAAQCMSMPGVASASTDPSKKAIGNLMRPGVLSRRPGLGETLIVLSGITVLNIKAMLHLFSCFIFLLTKFWSNWSN